MNKESNMNFNQLECDRDYWKAQHRKLKGQIQFFVGWKRCSHDKQIFIRESLESSSIFTTLISSTTFSSAACVSCVILFFNLSLNIVYYSGVPHSQLNLSPIG